jgi:hypothetical protein
MFSVPKTSGSHSHKGVDLMEGNLSLCSVFQKHQVAIHIRS